MIFLAFSLICQEKVKATSTNSLQYTEVENELQSECNRNPLSKALLLMHMAGQAVTSRSHVGTERQTQLLQVWNFARITYSRSTTLHCHALLILDFWPRSHVFVSQILALRVWLHFKTQRRELKLRRVAENFDELPGVWKCRQHCLECDVIFSIKIKSAEKTEK